MKRYVIASAATGEIVREVQCTDDQVAGQAQEGEVLIEDASARAVTHYVSQGAVVEYTPEQRATKQAMPAWSRQWDNTLMAWLDPRTLGDIKAAKWEAIKVAREEAKVAPLLDTPFGVFDADAVGMANIQGTLQGLDVAARLGNAPATVRWTLADNSYADLTVDQLSQVGVLLLMRGNEAHEKARQLREQIDAAQTSEALETISWA